MRRGGPIGVPVREAVLGPTFDVLGDVRDGGPASATEVPRRADPPGAAARTTTRFARRLRDRDQVIDLVRPLTARETVLSGRLGGKGIGAAADRL